MRWQPLAVALYHAAIVFPGAGVRLLREFRSFHPDVIHAHTFDGLRAGLVLRRLTGRPLVYTVPSSLSHIRECGYPWVPIFYARHHQHIDRFVTSYPRELWTLGVPTSKILFVPGMADVGSVESLIGQQPEIGSESEAVCGCPPTQPWLSPLAG